MSTEFRHLCIIHYERFKNGRSIRLMKNSENNFVARSDSLYNVILEVLLKGSYMTQYFIMGRISIFLCHKIKE